ncbi:TPA: 50S ribosomal protein L35 [candidate division CPR2 bacterium]|uniref:Large ribosomal subunit protein bL35 n=1 Tax=candidate division CPR2 bacterium GW2011_GWC1_41_48 TaxID=1618344 RepID=A0A0G0YI79_UNCC2|nr:MAG: 50S ribosomal protein L35 [candidate division CPR2 bacterium GW2011_GWC2_39_35]KKR28433.1 MAG: 50S ribosomal protein L35 [candidate division CPR2 bacterium GW2011_GWD2_39_7]KKS09241.1 MAG: 50S ribosomal protein L35 [candidate division CPR2 bacterium GW2011_GWC1_41_48]OGB72662.1 MAG: 50S ribosomal protein L35 [candidate division CPR2 bacterium GWD2_39_7]HBG81996.1 50S ribosomal protein L35 [candidate division CPR2 bacterium]
MPKLKVRSAAKKRFKITGSNKLKKRHAMRSHLLEKKATTRKRRLASSSLVSKDNEKSVKKMLGV